MKLQAKGICKFLYFWLNIIQDEIKDTEVEEILGGTLFFAEAYNCHKLPQTRKKNHTHLDDYHSTESETEAKA